MKKGIILIIVSILLFLLSMNMFFSDSNNSISELLNKVLGISFFATSLIAFMSGRGLLSLEKRQITIDKEREQETILLRQQLKEEILSEIKKEKTDKVV